MCRSTSISPGFLNTFLSSVTWKVKTILAEEAHQFQYLACLSRLNNSLDSFMESGPIQYLRHQSFVCLPSVHQFLNSRFPCIACSPFFPPRWHLRPCPTRLRGYLTFIQPGYHKSLTKVCTKNGSRDEGISKINPQTLKKIKKYHNISNNTASQFSVSITLQQNPY